ncbi:hypothetical protein BD410DRAFT_896232 [Rickenella mellea]|uniref:F-box domain-containing protein n=1 Tax=Rickenella mellea TaxID=50990 RepID=A0A4Y7QDP0_9AGAM|nr:hypothetical protein BD410DRAFT_896232 [Rickenella mellea]
MEADEAHGQTHSPTPHSARARAAPIASLSFELLSQVFLECLPPDGLPTASITTAPLLLGRICSYWRSVAFSTPQLWAGLELDDSFPNGPTKHALVVKEWTIRAGSCLLSYHLFFNAQVLDVILPYRSRWRHIEGNFEPNAWDTFYSVVTRCAAPHLRYLNIGILSHPPFSSHRNATPIEVTIPFPGASQLQSLFLKTDCNTHNFFDRMDAPSLRTLVFYGTNASLDSCWSCLRYCPNLEHFSATCQVKLPFTITPENDHVLEANQLKHLRLTLHFVDTGPFLDRLHAPALEKLEFNFYNLPEHPIGVPELSHFLKRSGAHLVDLNIDVPLTRDQILDCLHHTPALTSLELHTVQQLDDHIIQALTLRPEITHNNICVELQSLTLADGSDLSIEAIEAMILSRWGGPMGRTSSSKAPDEDWVRKLGHVILIRLDFGKDILLSERPKILRCVEEGLQVEEQPPERYDSDSSEDFYSSWRHGGWSDNTTSVSC